MIEIYYNKERQKVPIKSWVTDIESGALEQAKNLANLPFAFKWVALMPDSHQGYGMPIGGVLATKDYIIPNAVGVDIGCGMCASKSGIKASDVSIDQIKQIIGRIRQLVPVGFTHHKEAQDLKYMPNGMRLYAMDKSMYDTPVCAEEFNNALTQIGTLGGGNHFIELQKDEEDNLWIMIHSGSRNLGKTVADYYNKVAIEINKTFFSVVDKNQDLAFLPVYSDEGQSYLKEMNYCVEFALANRKLMMERCQQAVKEVLGETTFEFINIPHNYVALENHFGENVWVHRKGATRARLGEVGIIPGSQGTHSYIVRGLGNPESFESCSHGAGRKMGRNVARNTLNLQEEIAELDKKGIVHAVRHQKDLDEAPGSYKDIDVVMENQKDLVEILIKLTPLGVIKG